MTASSERSPHVPFIFTVIAEEHGFRVQFDQEALPLDNKGGDFDFKVVLIGLDGGIKYESRTFEPAEAYYGLIDRMPMRRAQMRKRIKNGG